ncbi:MAG: response regulator [Acidimicrobiales bacterium]
MTSSVPRSAAPLTGAHVLVVEDDRAVREMACHLLAGAGCAVVAAGSAEEAQELELAPFDLVFCDVMLPGASGIDLAAALGERRPGLPVLLTSGQRDADLRGAVEASGLPFLPKPYTAEALQLAVASALDRPAPA